MRRVVSYFPTFAYSISDHVVVATVRHGPSPQGSRLWCYRTALITHIPGTGLTVKKRCGACTSLVKLQYAPTHDIPYSC